MTDNDAVQHLLSALNILAPTGKDQQAASRMVSEMRREGENDKTICKSLTSFIYDGLAYGNWPSALEAMHQS